MRKIALVPALAAAFALAPFVSALADDDAVPAETPAAASAEKTSTPAGWTDDFEAAKKQASQEGKDLFVVFSGSDWCGWCVRLEEEVFSKNGFTEKISETFVPVFIDSPQDKSRLSALAKKQNPELVDRYRIQGYPTVLLLDAEGDVFAQTGYAAGGPEKYLQAVAEMQENGKNSPEYKARKAVAAVPENDARRAEKLDAVLAPLSAEAQLANVEYVEEVLAADPDGKRGFRAKYPYFTTVIPLENRFREELSDISRTAVAEIRKANLKPDDPKSQQAALRIFTKVFADNGAALSALQEEIRRARKIFPEDSLGADRLQELDKQISLVFERIRQQQESDASAE